MKAKNVFLLDGLGAIVSAAVTGGILPLYSQWLGISVGMLYAMAVLPIGYSIISLSCYFSKSKIQAWHLKLIIGLNLFYCLISLVLILSVNTMTSVGKMVLLSEIFVIFSVVILEYCTLQSLKSNTQKSKI